MGQARSAGTAGGLSHAHLQSVVGRREFARYTLDDVEAAYDRAAEIFEARAEACEQLRRRIAQLEALKDEHARRVDESVERAKASGVLSKSLAASALAGGITPTSAGGGSAPPKPVVSAPAAADTLSAFLESQERQDESTTPSSSYSRRRRSSSVVSSAPSTKASDAELRAALAVDFPHAEELVQCHAAYEVATKIPAPFVTRREFFDVFTDFDNVETGSVVALSMNVFNAFAENRPFGSSARGLASTPSSDDHDREDILVVNVAEVLVTLALYCNREEGEGRDSLDFCFELFTHHNATTIDKASMRRFVAAVSGAAFKIKLSKTPTSERVIDNMVVGAIRAADTDGDGTISRDEFVDWAAATLLGANVQSSFMQLRREAEREAKAEMEELDRVADAANERMAGNRQKVAQQLARHVRAASPPRQTTMTWNIARALARMRMRARSSVMVASNLLIRTVATETYFTPDEVVRLRGEFSRVVLDDALRAPIARSPATATNRDGRPSSAGARVGGQGMARTTGGGVAFKLHHFKKVMQRLYPHLQGRDTILERIFGGFDVDRSGSVDFMEFAAGLGKMAYGTPNEKLDMLFKLHALPNTPRVVKTKHGAAERQLVMPVDDLLKVATEHLDQYSDAAVFTADLLKRLDVNGDGYVTRDEFFHVIEENPIMLSLMTNCLLPGSDGMRGPFEEFTSRQSKFGMHLVSKLWHKYSFMGMSSQREVDLPRFRKMMREEFHVDESIMPIVTAMFEEMDTENKGAVSWRTVFFRLARVAHGSQADKASFIFSLIDADGSGDLEGREIMRFMMTSAEGAGASPEYRDVLQNLLTLYGDENGLVTKEKFNQACDDHPVLLTVFSRLFGRADDPRKFTRRTAAQQQAAQALSNIKAMLSGEGLFRGANRKERRSSLVMAATKRIDGLAKLDASKAKTASGLADSLDIQSLRLAVQEVHRQQADDAAVVDDPVARHAERERELKQRELVESILVRTAATRSANAAAGHPPRRKSALFRATLLASLQQHSDEKPRTDAGNSAGAGWGEDGSGGGTGGLTVAPSGAPTFAPSVPDSPDTVIAGVIAPSSTTHRRASISAVSGRAISPARHDRRLSAGSRRRSVTPARRRSVTVPWAVPKRASPANASVRHSGSDSDDDPFSRPALGPAPVITAPATSTLALRRQSLPAEGVATKGTRSRRNALFVGTGHERKATTPSAANSAATQATDATKGKAKAKAKAKARPRSYSTGRRGSAHGVAGTSVLQAIFRRRASDVGQQEIAKLVDQAPSPKRETALATAVALRQSIERAKRREQHSHVLRAHGRALAFNHLPKAYEALRKDLLLADHRIGMVGSMPDRAGGGLHANDAPRGATAPTASSRRRASVCSTAGDGGAKNVGVRSPGSRRAPPADAAARAAANVPAPVMPPTTVVDMAQVAAAHEQRAAEELSRVTRHFDDADAGQGAEPTTPSQTASHALGYEELIAAMDDDTAGSGKAEESDAPAAAGDSLASDTDASSQAPATAPLQRPQSEFRLALKASAMRERGPAAEPPVAHHRVPKPRATLEPTVEETGSEAEDGPSSPPSVGARESKDAEQVPRPSQHRPLAMSPATLHDVGKLEFTGDLLGGHVDEFVDSGLDTTRTTMEGGHAVTPSDDGDGVSTVSSGQHSPTSCIDSGSDAASYASNGASTQPPTVIVTSRRGSSPRGPPAVGNVPHADAANDGGSHGLWPRSTQTSPLLAVTSKVLHASPSGDSPRRSGSPSPLVAASRVVPNSATFNKFATRTDADRDAQSRQDDDDMSAAHTPRLMLAPGDTPGRVVSATPPPSAQSPPRLMSARGSAHSPPQRASALHTPQMVRPPSLLNVSKAHPLAYLLRKTQSPATQSAGRGASPDHQGVAQGSTVSRSDAAKQDLHDRLQQLHDSHEDSRHGHSQHEGSEDEGENEDGDEGGAEHRRHRRQSRRSRRRKRHSRRAGEPQEPREHRGTAMDAKPLAVASTASMDMSQSMWGGQHLPESHAQASMQSVSVVSRGGTSGVLNMSVASPRTLEGGDSEVLRCGGVDLAADHGARPKAVGGVRSLFAPDAGKEGVMLSSFNKQRHRQDLLETLSPVSHVMQNEPHSVMVARAALARRHQRLCREFGPPHLSFSEAAKWRSLHPTKSPDTMLKVSHLQTALGATRASTAPNTGSRQSSGPGASLYSQSASTLRGSSMSRQSTMAGTSLPAVTPPPARLIRQRSAANAVEEQVGSTPPRDGDGQGHGRGHTQRGVELLGNRAAPDTPQGARSTAAVTRHLLKTLAVVAPAQRRGAPQTTPQRRSVVNTGHGSDFHSQWGANLEQPSTASYLPPHPLASSVVAHRGGKRVKTPAPREAVGALASLASMPPSLSQSMASAASLHPRDLFLPQPGERLTFNRHFAEPHPLPMTRSGQRHARRRQQLQRKIEADRARILSRQRWANPAPRPYDVDELTSSLRTLQRSYPGSSRASRGGTSVRHSSVATTGEVVGQGRVDLGSDDDVSVYSRASDDILFQA